MITGFLGKMGAGKTISCIRQAYKDYQQGKTVYSNIDLKFPHKELTLDYILQLKDNKENLNNCTLVIDEIHIFMDSRRSMSGKNMNFSYFLLQTRKLGVTLYYTTQYENQIDKRLKNTTDMYVHCSGQDVYIKEYDTTIRFFVNDIFIKETNNSFTVLKDGFIGNPYYDLYNTYEVVAT